MMSNRFECVRYEEGLNTVNTLINQVNERIRNGTLQKKKLYLQQGPQLFRYGTLLLGHKMYIEDEEYSKTDVTEDSELVLNIGTECYMVMGDRFCIKVTYPEDLAIAESLHPLFLEKEKRYENEQNNI
jgi:2-C-methyl-D-erythritol 4-phosphate cytidylyltransferase